MNTVFVITVKAPQVIELEISMEELQTMLFEELELLNLLEKEKLQLQVSDIIFQDVRKESLQELGGYL